MSTQQDLIKLNEVIAQCNQLLKEQSDGWKSIVDEIKKVNSNAPSSYIKMQQEVANNLQRLEALEQKYNKTKESASRIQTKINTDVQKTLTTGASLEKQKQRELKLLEREEALLRKSENTYNKVQQKINALTQTYNNIATKKELGLKLTAREEAQLNSLTSRLEKYNGVLKKVDADIGKNQRNVGNYASGWNGLANSINQITREAPAFAVSMNTGFLALSNNIPILADEIQNLINKNKALQAQGKPTQSVLSSVLGSLLSWQTAISIGVTLLTLYGAELVKWVSQLVKGKEKIDHLKISKEELNNTMRDGVKNAQKEIIELNNYIKVAQNANLSTNERIKSANKLKETYPEYFKNMTTDKIMTADLTKIQNELTSALIARATAIASISKMTENATKILDLEEENRLANENLELLKERAKREQELFDEQVKTSRAEVFATRANKAYSAIEETQEAIRNRMEEIMNLQIRNAQLAKTAEANTAKSSNLETTITDTKKGKEQKDLSWEVREQQINNEIAVTKNFKEQMMLRYQLANEWYQNQLNQHKGNAQAIELATKQYTGRLIALNQQEYEYAIKIEDTKAKKILEIQKMLKDAFDKLHKDLDAGQRKRLEDEAKNLERIKNNLKSFFEEGTDGSLSSMGFGSLSQLFDEQLTEMWKNTESTTEKMAMAFQVFGNIANDVFAQLNQASQAYYDRQYERLEREKEVALTFAGDSSTGRAEIEKQYDEKKRQIEIEQAKRQKRLAIFQAQMNTAMGVVSAIARADIFPYNFVLAGIIGAMGLAQTAIIASQPLPEFWKGTDNAPEGFALTQEKGAEMITDKNGNIKTLGSNKGAQLTYLNKGDKVLTATETQQKLNEMLMTGSNGSVNIETNNGLSKEDMREVLNDTLAKQPKHNTIFDERGVSKFIETNNQRKIIRNRNARI